jgi:hypothetical protein
VWAGRIGIDVVDEGYFLSLADRVHQGALPYRDFETYYTPGIFYVYAGLFHLFGASVGVTRVMIAAMWGVYWLVLYGLARRVLAPAFAVLPFVVLAVAEPSPVWPAAHPGWLALLAALFTLDAVVRHHQAGRARWLMVAGAAAAVAFVFKQNVGAFAVLSVAGYVVLRPWRGRGPWPHNVRIAFVSAVALAVMILLGGALDGLLAAVLLLPLLGSLLVLVVSTCTADRSAEPSNGREWLRQVAVDAWLAGGAFVLVTLLWLTPLMLALGPTRTPFALFLGSVNQTALTAPVELPPNSARAASLLAIWLPVAVAVLRLRPRGLPWRPALGAALPASALILWLPTRAEVGPGLPAPLNPWPRLLEVQFGWMYVYIPAVCAWAALAALLWSDSRRALLSGPLPWYLLFGTLLALALYPRVDTLHAMMAGPPLFVVGAWALSRAHSTLTRGAGRIRQSLVFTALLVFPVMAVTPLVYWRAASVVLDNPLEPAPARYAPLGVERAQLMVVQRTATEIGGAVNFVRAHTQPGEPLLAYPMLPMVNFLADRPNLTRFNHFLPGALTPEETAGVIASLEANPPRYVVWDHAGVVAWETDPNRELTDYIWRCYEQVESFGLLLVLERRAC